MNELDTELDEPIRYVKKTRASLKNIQDMSGCLTESDVNKTLSQKPFLSQLSSSSSSVSSSSKKSETKCEDETEMDEFAYAKTRKSARFLNHTNSKTKSCEGPKTKPNLKNSKKNNQGEEEADKTAVKKNESPTGRANARARQNKLFRSERTIPINNQALRASIVKSDFLFHRGVYMQVGDIVALFDYSSGDFPYFAQVRAFLTDQYGEKSAVLTWLIPIDGDYVNRMASISDFDPSMFVLGPAEEVARPLDCLEFVGRLDNAASYKLRPNELFSSSYQYSNELQRHKYLLDDLAEANLTLVSRQSGNEHEIKWTN